MKAVKIKKNGGPEVLDVEKISLRKPIKIRSIYLYTMFNTILESLSS